MAIPNNAVNYGNGNKNRNIFQFYTDQALSSLIKYECYDNDQTFPAVDTVTTTTNIVLAGTTKNGSKSMVALIDTTNAAPSTNDWKPWSATAGEANPNRMRGQTSYVEQDGSALTAGTGATFNMVCEVPSDVLTTNDMGFDLLVRYTYTGAAPTPLFKYNDDASGTEGTPTWITMTPDTQHGIKHCRAGSTSSDLYANIPADAYVSSAIADAAGLDDLTSGGSFTDTSIAKFEVEIDATGTPDTFKWRKNEGSYTTGVSITGSAQTLSDGVTVTFAATTGHTLADVWTVYAGAEDTAEGWATT